MGSGSYLEDEWMGLRGRGARLCYISYMYGVAILAQAATWLPPSHFSPLFVGMGGRAKGRGGKGGRQGRQLRLPALHYGLPGPAAATSS
eukprot:6580871-Heterocapsa_arctica.AAC.1